MFLCGFMERAFKARLSRVLFSGLLLFPAWCAGTPLLPPQFEGEMCKIRPGTYPSRLVVKYFDPIDKGLSVEIGQMVSSVYEILYNADHQAYCFKEFDLEGNLKEQYDRVFSEGGLVETELKRGFNQLVELSCEYNYGRPMREDNLESQKFYTPDKELLYVETFYRDKAGNVTSMQRSNAEGELLHAYEYDYDEEGNLEREVRLNASGERVSEEEYAYGEKGEKTTGIRYDSQGKVVSHTDYRYDEAGLMKEVTLTSPEGFMHRYKMQYEYDDQGNWIKLLIRKGGDVPVSIIVRMIEYF